MQDEYTTLKFKILVCKFLKPVFGLSINNQEQNNKKANEHQKQRIL